MFVHKEQLEYQLSPSDYFSEAMHRAELERLLLPAWHPLALTDDFATDGDFRTFDLLGRPLLVRRDGGVIRAYLNVCSHRHCVLTEAARGHSEKLACQYHGWEYAPGGQVSRVPDGGCFRPFDRENARLHSFDVETCGSLVFVRLVPGGDDLRTTLGADYDRIAAGFARPYACNWTYDRDFDCNWKIPVENTVETYHLPWIHPSTLGGFGLIPEEAQKHYLQDRSTTLVYQLDPASEPVRTQRRVVRWLGGPATHDQYVHLHVFPNLVFTFTDLFIYAQVYLPVTPTRSRTLAWMFSLDGPRRNPFARLIARLAARHGARSNEAIQREDASVFSSLQRGLAASPFRGCIGTREERIWCFHDHLRRACGTVSGG